MAAQLYYSPFIPAFSPNGLPVPGAKLFFFYSGTDTLAPIYTTESLSTRSINPVTADLAARFSPVYLDGNITYRVRLLDSDGIQLGSDLDPYVPGQALKGEPGPTGAANNTYTSYTALLASNPSRRYAYLVGDTDTPPKPDGVFSNPTSVLGAWVRQKAEGITVKQTGSDISIDLGFKVTLRVDIEDFGAKGDGLTDDTLAFEKMFSSVSNGAVVNLRPGARYIVKRTLVFNKAICFMGGGREQTIIQFAADGNYLAVSGGRAAVIFMHPSVIGINGYNGQPLTGYSGRAILRGVGFTGSPGMQPTTNGMFVAAPIYGYELDVLNFTGNGYAIVAGADTPNKGNANGTTLTNCNAQFNTLSGFTKIGNDANRCILQGCNAASNGDRGYYDDSLLGNTSISNEADNNGVGGYFQTKNKPSRSLYLAPYSETPEHFSLNPRSAMIGLQGLAPATRSIGAAYFGGLPSGEAYINKGVVYAISETIANVLGGPTDPGKALRISEEGIEWRMNAGQDITRFTGIDGPNYMSLYVAGAPAARWCAMNVTGNLVKGRQWAVGGISFGTNSAITGEDTAPPTTGIYDVGAIVMNKTPSAGGKLGWVCVVAGSPGTWKGFGTIDS